MLLLLSCDRGHKQKRIELQGEFFRKAEELETSFAEQLATKAVALASSDVEHADQDLAIFLQDSEALKSTLSSSNDMHVGKLISTEDSMRDDFNNSVRGCCCCCCCCSCDRLRVGWLVGLRCCVFCSLVACVARLWWVRAWCVCACRVVWCRAVWMALDCLFFVR